MNVLALRIHKRDNVAVAMLPLAQGQTIPIEGQSLAVITDVPKGHKIALGDLPAGAEVIKYGHPIGSTNGPVAKGTWVHGHNLRTNLADLAEYHFTPAPREPVPRPVQPPCFQGYRRQNGRVGTRNEIWILNTVGCINKSAENIARLASERFRDKHCDGIFAFPHPYGCSQLGDDLRNTQKLLAGLMQHPNAGGVLVLGLGCENNQLDDLLRLAPEMDPTRLRSLCAQSVPDEIEAGVQAVGELFARMTSDRREECSASDLVLGMKCGGSDAFSGITANPLVGRITDLVTAWPGRVILSEVPEMFGAEQLLMNRAQDEAVYAATVHMINRFKEYFLRHGQPIHENPSPGNKDGGITTLEEKSLGAIQKGGQSTITQVLDYGEPITARGLALLNAPGNDGVSATALTASGATLLLFTTGRGTPFGFPVPTIKIATNTALATSKPNWIDFNAGQLTDGTAPIPALTDQFLSYLLEVASGRIQTKNEQNGYREIAIWKDGVTL